MVDRNGLLRSLLRLEEYERQEAHEAYGADRAVEDDDGVIPYTSDDSEGEEDQEDEEITCR